MSRSEAPLDREALAHCVAPFGESKTLPSDAYASEEVLEWELEHLFEGSWVCVGRSQDLGNALGQRGVRAGRETILLTRAGDRELRAFFNVCRHRGHELVEPGQSLNARLVRCPYHGWSYGLDGSLRAAPQFPRDALDASDHALVPARLAEWRGWMFVNADGKAQALSEHVADLEPLVTNHEPERLRAAARRRYDVAANWKVVVENYHECYHCPQLHPELCRVSPPAGGRNFTPGRAWVGGWMELAPGAQTMSLTGDSDGALLQSLDETARRRVYYLGLFPNLLLSLHPDYVMTHRIEPIAAARSIVECEWLFAPEATERAGFDPSYALDFWDLTNRQDWRACERVQRGVESRGYRQGPLSPREDALYDFTALIARSYLQGRLALR